MCRFVVPFLVLVFCVVVCGAVAETAVNPREQIVSSGPIVHSAQSYWTAERMSKAQPYPMYRPGTGFAPKSVSKAVQTRGPEGSGEAELPDGYPRGIADTSSPLSPTSLVPKDYSYPPPFSRYENFDEYSVYPYSTVAKVFFTAGGRDYVCSGASWPNRGVITAGHCVYDKDTGKYHTNVVVVPQYKNGTAPFGSFSATQLVTLQGWQDGDWAYDMGLIITATKDGRKLSSFTGNLGAKWNASSVQHWTIIGYPAAKPFKGNVQQICQTSLAWNDDSENPATSGAGCDLTGGSSGCPWIVKFGGRGGPWNYCNGVMSYGYTNQKKVSYSPYFGNGAKTLWDYAKKH